MEKPKALVELLPSGRTLIRFNELHELFWYDEYENNPRGISVQRNMSRLPDGKMQDHQYVTQYKRERSLLNERKNKIIQRARKELTVDKDFLTLVYKAKSDKRGFEMSKFGGILSMPHYARGEDKMFKKSKVGEKKITLNMAFQVGTMCGGDYTGSFVAIMKTILMAQALNISLNIDMFDSDRGAPVGGGYVICNVAKSSAKLNLKNILACSHPEFFNVSLFNGYSASSRGCGSINGFLSQHEIVRDLSSHYDIIGGNMLHGETSHNTGGAMMSKILKIAWK
jgi:hypothetical protein